MYAAANILCAAIGFFPDVGASYPLSRLRKKYAPYPSSLAAFMCKLFLHFCHQCHSWVHSVLCVDLVTYSYGTYLALTGRRVTGEEAMNLGIATHFVHSSRLPVRSHAS